jgi:hypothetical protein
MDDGRRFRRDSRQTRDLDRVLVFVLRHLLGDLPDGHATQPLVNDRAVKRGVVAPGEHTIKIATRGLHPMDDLRDGHVLSDGGIIVVRDTCARHARLVLSECTCRAFVVEALDAQEMGQMRSDVPVFTTRDVAELLFTEFTNTIEQVFAGCA